METTELLLAFLAGLVLACLTTPVGVSGAVFLLPFHLSVLHLPHPAVTPTNLLYNVVSGPGGLARFRRRAAFDRTLASLLLLGCVPGVVLGAVLRVHVVSDPDLFRALAALVLAPVGWSLLRRRPGPRRRTPLPRRAVLGLALVVGTVGGTYGIGGGSLLGPVLVASGMTVGLVAPAALLSTWVTSLVGVATFAVLDAGSDVGAAPDWPFGMAAGLGGLLGGWIGAGLQPHLPEPLLRRLLGVLALVLAAAYAVQVALG